MSSHIADVGLRTEELIHFSLLFLLPSPNISPSVLDLSPFGLSWGFSSPYDAEAANQRIPDLIASRCLSPSDWSEEPDAKCRKYPSTLDNSHRQSWKATRTTYFSSTLIQGLVSEPCSTSDEPPQAFICLNILISLNLLKTRLLRQLRLQHSIDLLPM
jgi:hypothetical protein